MQMPINSPIEGIRAWGRTVLFAAVAATIAISSLAFAASGQITRTELYRSDLAGSETAAVIVAQLEIAPGATVPRHSHNGTEHLVVLQGGTMALPNGDTRDFLPGATMDFPRGFVHGGLTNVGDKPIVLITVQIVDKNAPLNVPAA